MRLILPIWNRNAARVADQAILTSVIIIKVPRPDWQPSTVPNEKTARKSKRKAQSSLETPTSMWHWFLTNPIEFSKTALLTSKPRQAPKNQGLANTMRRSCSSSCEGRSLYSKPSCWIERFINSGFPTWVPRLAVGSPWTGQLNVFRRRRGSKKTSWRSLLKDRKEGN